MARRGWLVGVRGGRSGGGSIPACWFFAGAHGALHFSLQILAKTFRNDARGRQFPQLGNSELGKIGKNRGERSGGVADKGQAHALGGAGPRSVKESGK